MDGNRSSLLWESIKLSTGIYLWSSTFGWFGIENLHPSLPGFILGYLIFSFIGTVYFFFQHRKNDQVVK
jgi:hypothetical protein